LAVPNGFSIQAFATGLQDPRLVRVAPNGDIFVAESAAGRVRALRAADGAGKASKIEIFAAGLDGPFGIAFYPLGTNPQWLYVATNNQVVRFAYRSGDLQSAGAAQIVVAKLADTVDGHSTRDIVFSPDGSRMFVSVGSGSNIAEDEPRKSAAAIRTWQSTHALGAA
jgi:hypothetical protein